MRIEGLTVREVVRSTRELLEMTQADLAKNVGITSAYVSMLESGRRYPRVQYQNDIYWRLSGLIGGAAPGGRLAFYADLIAIDLLEREPGLFELLGNFFYREMQRGMRQAQVSGNSGRREESASCIREPSPPREPGVGRLARGSRAGENSRATGWGEDGEKN